MADRLQVPRVAELLGPGIDAIVAARPHTKQFINLGGGRYADLVAGWESQLTLFVRQLTDEVKSARLRLAVADALTQTAHSEFETDRQTGQTRAVGQVALARSVGALPGGVLREGFRFNRLAATSYNPAIQAASYTVARDTTFKKSATTCSVPIIATLGGPGPNAPYYDGDNTAGGVASMTFGETAFDPNITIVGYEAAGGADGETDDDLRLAAGARALGRYGPTTGAITAGAFAGVGVHRVAVFEVVEVNDSGVISPAAYTGVAIADGSWGSGFGGLPSGIRLGVWENLVAQTIANSYQGFGAQVIVSGTGNVRLQIEPTIKLRNANDLKDTSEIDAALLLRARSYFDDRPDWYTWTNSGLRAWLSRSHSKILSCTSVTIRRLADGAILSDPPAIPLMTSAGISVTHGFLADNAVIATYSAAA